MFFNIFQYSIFITILVSFCDSRAPELESLPSLKNVEKDVSIVLTCNALKGTKPITFEWFHNVNKLFASNDISIDSKSSASHLTFERVQLEHAGNYSCLATNSYGSDLSFTFLQVEGKFLMFFSCFSL